MHNPHIEPTGSLSRRRILGLAGGAAVTTAFSPLAAAGTAAASTEGAAIVRSGQPHAVVVRSTANASQTAIIQRAAIELVELVRRATGATLPLLTDAEFVAADHESSTVIRISGPVTPDDADLLRGGNDTGFVISAKERDVRILGSTGLGPRYGVYDFVERYVGVQWLWPGADGEYVPALTDLVIPFGLFRDDTALHSRYISPFPGGAASNPADAPNFWAAHQRIHSRIVVGHRMYSLVPTALYGDPSTPSFREDFYPIWDGKRHIPAVGETDGWQPRFGATGLADAIAEQIMTQFQKTPTVTSISLSINDGGGHSDDDFDGTKRNSLGMADASTSYWSLVNDVVDRVAPELPPTMKFCALAYASVTDAPTFRMHPSVVPFLCYDRYGWVDPQTKAVDQARTEAWYAVSDNVSFYEYAYGAFYALPRVHMRALADAYRWAGQRGLSNVYAELYPNFVGEGPKNLLYTKLLWNTDRDHRAILHEWTDQAVGRRAAGHLRAYFDEWERFWEKDVPQSDWFHQERMYFAFSDSSYLALTSRHQIAGSRRKLEYTVELADTPTRKARAAKILKSFEYYEASALSYPKETEQATSAGTLLQVLRDTVEHLDESIELAGKRERLLTEYAADPALKFPIPLNGKWTGWNLHSMWDTIDYLSRNSRDSNLIHEWLTTVAANHSSAQVRRFAGLTLNGLAGHIVRPGENISFDDGTTAPWRWNSSPAYLNSDVRLDTTITADPASTASLRFPAGFSGFFAQSAIPISPGAVHCRARFRADGPASVRAGWLFLDVRDASNRRVLYARTPAIRMSKANRTWRTVAIAEMVPDGAVSATLRVQTESDVAVNWDSVEIRQVLG